MSLIGLLNIGVQVSTDKATKGLQSLEGSISSITSKITSFAGVGAAISGVLGGLSVAGIAAESLKAYGEQEQANAKLQSVLNSTGHAAGYSADQLISYAGDLQMVTTFADETSIAAEGVLATFTQIKGPIFKDAVKSAQDLSTIMGQDLQSSIVQIGKALNDPIKGMTALRKIGVSFTTEQIAEVKKLVAAGDTYSAQLLILKELQTEFGGASEAAANTVLGRLQMMKNQVGELGETIGGVLAPSVQALATIWTQSIVGMNSDLQDLTANSLAFATVIGSVGDYLQAFGLLGKFAFLGFHAAAMAASEGFWLLAKVIDTLDFGLTNLSGKLGKLIDTDMHDLQAEVDGIDESWNAQTFSTKLQIQLRAQAVAAAEAKNKVMGLTAASGELAAAQDQAAVAADKEADKLAEAYIRDADKQQAGIGALNDKLREQIATFGMSSREAEIYHNTLQRTNQTLIDEANALDKQLTALEEQKKMQEEATRAKEKDEQAAKDLTDSVKTTAEKQRDEYEKVRDLKEKGLIDQETYERRQKQIDAMGKESDSGDHGVKMERMGSQAAQATILRATKGTRPAKTDNKQLAVAQQQLIYIRKIAMKKDQEVFDFA